MDKIKIERMTDDELEKKYKNQEKEYTRLLDLDGAPSYRQEYIMDHLKKGMEQIKHRLRLRKKLSETGIAEQDVEQS